MNYEQAVQDSHKIRNIIIISAIVVAVLGLVTGILYYVVSKDGSFEMRSEEKELFTHQLEFTKCLSLCPVEETDSVEGVRDFEPNCYRNCEYYNDIVRGEDYTSEERNRWNKISNLVRECRDKLKNETDFDYISCLNKILEENKHIADMTGFVPREYIVYKYSINNLDCSVDEVVLTVRLDEGENNINETIFLFNSNDGFTMALKEKESLSFGEQKTFRFNREERRINFNITNVGISFILNDGTVLHLITKEC